MIGQTFSHYTILEKLGAGGMGIVYRAEDIKLKRTVALKFLPKGLEAHEPERARFLQEAQAAAALNHPNICTIHDIAAEGDDQFIVMEYVDGVTLRSKIADGRLQIAGAVQFAIQISEALQEAHSKGIVHRDVKPENIMVNTKNQVKVMDFGLAKLKGSLKLTRTSSTVGTAAYMSPEQAQGLEVDHRTDIWSVGVVLFEMLTGRLPFRGVHEAALLYSIVHEEPQGLASVRADVPRSVATIIQKALQKECSRRCQTMKEMMSELKGAMVPTVETSKQEKSIVVLPFENLSPDPDQEYFSDGLTEEVISDLSAARSLRVISRSSAMTFKGTRTAIPEIARKLNVQYVLEGSVRKAGNNLRITAQLIDATSDVHLWAEKYSGTLDDVFDIQEKVSRAIVKALKLKLSAEEEHKMLLRPIEDLRAYECYLKANAETFKWTAEGSEQAIRYLKSALNLIGDNALLYSGIAWAYWNLVNIGVGHEECIASAEEYVQKALKIDPDCPKALALLGWIRFYGRLEEAVHYFREALSSNPDEHLALLGLATVYIWYLGKIPAAVPLCEKLEQIEPLDDASTLYKYVAMPFFDGRFEEAVKGSNRLFETSPQNPYVRLYHVLPLIFVGQYEKAFAVVDKTVEMMPDHVCAKLQVLLKHAIKGERTKIHEALTPFLKKTCERDPDYSEQIAAVLAVVGEKDEALQWLENAVNRDFLNYPFLNQHNPLFANLRADERFKNLMVRVKKEWEEFEV
ncbi:MAG: hypothetical protein FJ215_08185 [Ignavibacteria bacterium]|nr:hypothetical protein [Ignavibacteria bacterium]